MISLKDREWKSFFIAGNNGLFTLRASNSGIDKNKLISSGAENTPYITRTNNENGLNLFVSNIQQDKYKIDKGNVITIGLDTQTAFYQPFDFYTGQNIQVLYNEHINKYTGLFVVKLLEIQMKKFNWGGNGATLGRLARTKIMLPINGKNEPDYEFMEAYMRERESNLRKIQIAQIQKRLKSLGNATNIEPLNNKIWKAFKSKELFDDKKGNQNNMNQLSDGTIPLISAKNNENGLKRFAEKNNKSVFDGNTISLNCDGDGGVGYAYYQPTIYMLDSHCKSLKPKEKISKHVLLFIASMFPKQRGLFSHGRAISDTRYKELTIMLPVNYNDEPDYEYMEQYIKNLEIDRYSQFLSYLNRAAHLFCGNCH